MSTILSPQTTNSYIELLEKVLSSSQKPVEYLMISHNDSSMVKAVSKALAHESAAVLEISQDTWDYRWEELTEMVEWALQNADLKHVVLVGHSQVGSSKTKASLIGGESEKERMSLNSYDRLIAKMKEVNAHNLDTKKQFASHVQALSQVPLVRDRVEINELAVYGLFYRSEGDVFLVYELETDAFRPLFSY